jgi:septum formation protein
VSAQRGGKLGLILASTSPRRAALLAEAGIDFEPLDPGVRDADEEDLARRWRVLGLAPGDISRRLAVAKALAAARIRRSGLVLAADTVVVVEGRALGKPRDEADARAMIELLAGKTHEVTTGVALLDLATGRLEAETETSRVSFRAVDESELSRFLASGTWAGKAGAYGVQDEAAKPLVAGVEGSRSNVVGLPVERVRALLARTAVALVALLALAGCPHESPAKPDTAASADARPASPPAAVAPPASGSPTPTPGEVPVNPPPRDPAPETGAYIPDTEEGAPSHGLPEATLEIKGTSVTVELATSEPARRLGLMHRDSMPADRGMLFVFPESQKQVHNFWMHNTRLPLSIAYILDDGTIRNIEDMEPFDERTRHPSAEPVRLALEVNKGWFTVHSVHAGDRITGITPGILEKGE